MRILITGHLGFIGSHLKDLFPEAVGWDLKSSQDIRTKVPTEDFTHIFHLAAKRSVPIGEEEPEEFISNNCWGTCRIIKLFPTARIINVSSSAAEEALSVYGATKNFAEKIGNQHPNCLNVRLYNVFGERQPLESGAVVPRFINAMLRKEAPIVYGFGGPQPQRDFTYVKDVVAELRRLMFDTDKTGLAHVGYSDSINLNELLKKIFGYLPPFSHLPLRSYEIKYSKAPYSMTARPYGRDEGIKQTIEWWKNQ